MGEIYPPSSSISSFFSGSGELLKSGSGMCCALRAEKKWVGGRWDTAGKSFSFIGGEIAHDWGEGEVNRS